MYGLSERTRFTAMLGSSGYFAGVQGFPHCNSPICRICPQNKYDAIRNLIRRSPAFGEIRDIDGFVQTVIQREELQSTGIGHGVAIAHGKFEGVDRVAVGLGICSEGLDFDAVDQQPVHLLFVIASNPERQNEYLRTLSWLMKYLKNETLRQALVCPCLGLIDRAGACKSFVDSLASSLFRPD